MGTGCEEAASEPCLEGCGLRPSVETGASVPGYSGGAERLSERLFSRGPDAKKRFRSRVLRDVA